MDPYSTESKRGTDDVAVQENLVEGVANRGWRLDEEEGEGNSALTVLAPLEIPLEPNIHTMSPVMMNSLPVMDA